MSSNKRPDGCAQTKLTQLGSSTILHKLNGSISFGPIALPDRVIKQQTYLGFGAGAIWTRA
jgi:hypothetical protein